MQCIGVTGVIFLLICVAFQRVHPQIVDKEGLGLISQSVEKVMDAVASSSSSPKSTPKTQGSLASSDDGAQPAVNPTTLEFLEKFRQKMTTGIPELKIPVLEPLIVGTIGVSYNDPGIANIAASIKDIVVTNLSSFVANQANYSLTERSVTAKFTFPELTIKGLYEVSGTLNNRDRISAAGPFHIKLYKFRSYVNSKIEVTKNNVMYVKTLDFDYSVGSVKTNFQNLTRYKDIDRYMNVGLESFLPEALEIAKPQILPPVRNYIISYVNKTIEHYGLNELIYLTQFVAGPIMG